MQAKLWLAHEQGYFMQWMTYHHNCLTWSAAQHSQGSGKVGLPLATPSLIPTALPCLSSLYSCLGIMSGCHALAIIWINSTIKASSLILNASGWRLCLSVLSLLKTFHFAAVHNLISRRNFPSDACKEVLFRASCLTQLWAHKKGRTWLVQNTPTLFCRMLFRN